MMTREALKMMTWVEEVENNVIYGQKCYKFPKTHKANVFAQNLFGTNDGNFFVKWKHERRGSKNLTSNPEYSHNIIFGKAVLIILS